MEEMRERGKSLPPPGEMSALITCFGRGTFAPKPETLPFLVAGLRRFSGAKFSVTLRVCNF
jgi:hypothetical protein